MSFADLLPSAVSQIVLAALVIIALVAGMARGFSGFGAALIFMPLASTVASPHTVAALLLIIDFISAAPLIPNAWKHANRKEVAVMALGAAIGVPLGTYALTQLDPITTRWIIAAFVFALLTLLISGWRYHGKGHPAAAVSVGGLSGFCSGLAQTGGPPVITYWLGQSNASTSVRANIVLFFAMSGTFSVASYLVSGFLTADVAKLALIVGPSYAFGLFLGTRIFGIASEVLFRRVCYSLIALAAISSLPVLDGFLGRY